MSPARSRITAQAIPPATLIGGLKMSGTFRGRKRPVQDELDDLIDYCHKRNARSVFIEHWTCNDESGRRRFAVQQQRWLKRKSQLEKLRNWV
jgi:hypothetical protein